MSKLNITFNNKQYNIDESAIALARDSLKTHLSTVMNGEGGASEPVIEPGATLTFKPIIDPVPELFTELYEGGWTYFYWDEYQEITYRFLNTDRGLGFLMSLSPIGPGMVYVYRDQGVAELHGVPCAGWYDENDNLCDAPVITISSNTDVDGTLKMVGSELFQGSSTGGSTTITLDGTSYQVDPTKLQVATDNFVAHIETLSGGGGLEPITWDGVVDGRPTIQFFDYTVVKVSDTILTADNLANSTMTSNTGAEYPMPTNYIITVGGAVAALEGAIVSVSDVNVDVGGQLFVFPETGTYFADRLGGEYIQSLTFAGGSTGGDTKLTIGGVDYMVDSAKMSKAVAELETVLGGLHSEDDDAELTILDEAILENTILD